jgi:Xaa-Pro aminopeptidase
MHTQQRQQTTDLLKQRACHRALFTQLDSIKWLTGYSQPLNIGLNPFEALNPLLWYENGTFTLIVLDAYAPLAKDFAEQSNCRVITYEGYTIQKPITTHENLLEALDKAIGNMPPRDVIGVEQRALLYSVRTFIKDLGTDLETIDDWLVDLRSVKTNEELTLLRRNFNLVDLGQQVAREQCLVGQREIDVWTSVHAVINREVGMPIFLGNDCIVGYRAPNNVGGLPQDFVIKDDSALIVDLSTVWGGYWSDSCGTYYPIEPTSKQKELHRYVQDALEFAISLVKPSVKAREIDEKVREFITKGGYPVYPHHTGHGVGASAHEQPRIVPYNDMPLREGMVIMLEPGIYYPGETSVRLEDAVLVTADGAEKLTTFAKHW